VLPGVQPLSLHDALPISWVQLSAETLLICATRRDLRRAAAFLWMTPLDAALSMRLMARRRRSAASSAPDSAAVTADLVRDLSSRSEEHTSELQSREKLVC